MPDDLALLMALRVQGVASPERVGHAVGAPPDTVAQHLEALASSGLAAERTGRVAGFSLTPAGAERVAELLETEALRDNEELNDAYQRFLLLNQRLLEISTAWQVRRRGAVEEHNDHSDASYDHGVIDRLVELHDRAVSFLARLDAVSPRFTPYAGRLQACVERLRSGDMKAFTHPLGESYHTVWFELHQDFLLTLGLERETA